MKVEENMEKIRKRSEVPTEDTWDLTPMVKNHEDFEEKLKRTYELLEEVEKFKGHILDSAESLLAFYKKTEEYDRLSTLLYIWSHLNIDNDTTDSKRQEYVEKIDRLSDIESEKLSFISPEMMKKPYEEVLKMIDENKELELYRHELEVFYREQAHILSDEEEALLGKLNGILGNNKAAFSKLNNADIDYGTIHDEEGKEVLLTNANYVLFMNSKDRRVRKEAFQTLYQFWQKHKNTVSMLYKGEVKEGNTLAKVRKYDSLLEASLASDHIPVSFYHKIIQIVHNHLEPLYRYLEIRRKNLGVDELHMYDLHVDLSQNENKKYSFEEGKELLMEALKPLGEQYLSDLSQGFTDRWIDKYPNVGKRSGAYQWSCYDSTPYVLLNYTGDLDSVSTMGHELGHAMHTFYSRKHQPYIYHNYPIVLAEIASTVNEVLLNDYLTKHATTKEEKMTYISDLLNMCRTTIYRQMMFAEFEMKIHDLDLAGKPITEQVLSDTYYELNQLYHGQNVVSDTLIRYEWERIPHFYTPFYVYKYATGLSAALAFATRILKGEEHALEDYLTFLSSGSSADPFEILKKAGLDMESGKPVEAALVFFEQKVCELEELLK